MLSNHGLLRRVVSFKRECKCMRTGFQRILKHDLQWILHSGWRQSLHLQPIKRHRFVFPPHHATAPTLWVCGHRQCTFSDRPCTASSWSRCFGRREGHTSSIWSCNRRACTPPRTQNERSRPNCRCKSIYNRIHTPDIYIFRLGARPMQSVLLLRHRFWVRLQLYKFGI